MDQCKVQLTYYNMKRRTDDYNSDICNDGFGSRKKIHSLMKEKPCQKQIKFDICGKMTNPYIALNAEKNLVSEVQ